MTTVHRRRGRLRYKGSRDFAAPASPRAMVPRASIPAAIPNFARGSVVSFQLHRTRIPRENAVLNLERGAILCIVRDVNLGDSEKL